MADAPKTQPENGTGSFLLIAAALALFTLLFFWRATGFGFVYPGEMTQLLSNAQITGSAGLAAAFSLTQPWQPLAWLSHMFDFSLFGPKPEAQRAVNLLLHAANTALLFLLFRRWLGVRYGVFLAVLFAIHPLRVEPVLWLVERRMLLTTLFVLLATRAHIARTETGSAFSRGLVLLWGTLAALSHPLGAVLPVLLLLIDVWPLERAASLATRVMEKLELAAIGLATLAMSAQAAPQPDASWTYGVFDTGTRLLNAAAGVGMALLRTVLPFPLSIMNGLEPPLWAALLLVLLCAAAFWLAPVALRVGLGWFLVAMLPTLGLLHPGIAPWSDSGTYLAHVGLFAALVWLGSRWDADKLTALCFTAALVWLGLSWLRMGEWQGSEPLLRSAIERSGHPLARYQLGQLLVQAKRGPEAEKEFREILKTRPKHVESQLLLASSLLLQMRNQEATAVYRETLRTAPERAETYFALGLLQTTTTGQGAEGVTHLAEGIRRGLTKDQEAQAENAIGVHWMNQKQYGPAEEHLKKSWTLVPTYASAHRNYALTLDGMGQPKRAFKHLEKARIFTKDAPEVIEVWAILFNKLAGEEKKKFEEEQRQNAAQKK